MSLDPAVLTPGARRELAGAPPGLDARALAELAAAGRDVLHVAQDDARVQTLAEALAFFAPGARVLRVPAWDCLPYDRVSPQAEIVSKRIDAFATLTAAAKPGRIVLTTVNAVTQRVPPRAMFERPGFAAKPGERLALDELVAFLARNGYVRAETVREPGEYARRGGLIDLFPPGTDEPLRLDLFGDVLETVRRFDPNTQRSLGPAAGLVLRPVSEALLDPEAIERFRSGYRELFGAAQGDPLYEAISAGRRYGGFEHWLPLFHEKLETLLDYLPAAAITLDHQADDAIGARFEQIEEAYEARAEMVKARELDGPPYRPLPSNLLYLGDREWAKLLKPRAIGAFSPFAPAPGAADAVDLGGRPGPVFAAARQSRAENLFDAVRAHLEAERAAGRRVVVAAYSEGSRDRLATLLAEHGVEGASDAASFADAGAGIALAVLGLERGFVAEGLAVVSEQDILGERLVRAAKRRVRAENFIAEASTLAEGDLVVHVDHGVGRFEGLVTIEAAGAPHDCLKLAYADNDRLFVPVENLDVLSRYGADEGGAQLDRLGGAAWQARKARVKQRIAAVAHALLRIAAERRVREGEPLVPAEGPFHDFCSRFPFPETEDQARAIEDTLGDLASGRPMDRLICGDVGFGKTEIALRAAFVAATAGKQVAICVPTTLLCRQHHRVFTQRFAGFPVRIAQISRLVSAKDAAAVKQDLAAGQVDIVVGTTALLAKSIAFRDLGLLIVDEEQHFGVKQKERLKELKANVHVLTLTATPIPRTLQMALAGVRDMSIIASPPIDRLAVRTFVMPWDPVIVREAIMRERFRGGQTFFVCPRIEDLDAVRERLGRLVPEGKVAVAHGQLAPSALEDVMTAFTDGEYDVLLSTNIVESGLDMPRVNTIVIHRADMFGLAQLYQLRGRVGRSKLRAYAFLTTPSDRVSTPAARKRLEVMQTLDQLGAGFQLASYDLDIRGAGNLLGEEQSGHIREVGIELYQQMLEDAVHQARAGAKAEGRGEWSPQINLGMPVLIPEKYVEDLGVRLALYRRLAGLTEKPELDAFAAELVDRFGRLPAEVDNLLETIAVKQLCRRAGVERIEAGPKGATVAFRANRFAKPDKLIAYISKDPRAMKVRPDQRLVFMADWDEPRTRMKGVAKLVGDLAKLAA